MINLFINLKNFIGLDRLIFIVQILGYYMLITGFYDAYKYHWQHQAIKKVGIAKGHSRKFILAALHNDHIKIMYLFFSGLLYSRFDWFLISTSIIAVFYMTELFFTIYRFYPYRMRGCPNFKRPNLILYLINSIMPNRIRKRL
jgi:disulfide bond formation protein DsbB